MEFFERLILPFRGLFFATPALPGIGGGDMGGGGDDGGAGGGDGGAGDEGDAGDLGDVVADDEPTDDGGDVESDEPDSEGVDDGIEGDEADGKSKTGKPDVDSALKKLRKLDPKSAEVVRREHFQNQQYRGVGTLQEVQGMKDFMMLHGGEQEISTKIEQGDRFAVELDMVANGDPAIVTDIARESPEGLMKLGPSVLAEMERIDQKRYGAMMASPIAKLIKSTGAFQLMQNIRYCIQKGMQEDGMKAANELVDWVNQVEQLGESQRSAQPSEQDQKLSQRAKDVETKETQLYQGEVGKTSATRTNEVLGKHMRPLVQAAKLKGVNLTQAQKQDFERGVWDHVSNSLRANSTYQRQMKAFYAKKAPASEIADYVAQNVERLALKATQEVWQLKGWASRVRGGKPVAGGNGNGNGARPAIMLGKPPQPEDIDWSKTPHTDWMGDGRVGKAVTKTGKSVRFRWD